MGWKWSTTNKENAGIDWFIPLIDWLTNLQKAFEAGEQDKEDWKNYVASGSDDSDNDEESGKSID